MQQIRSVIVATGCRIPDVRVRNDFFLEHEFHGEDGRRIDKPSLEILRQFEAITGIRERRYVREDQVASDIAFDAAAAALDSSGIDREQLDYILLAHNFGDVRSGSHRSDLVPALAARVKAKLEIRNPRTVALDLLFGCPGWLQGVILGDSMIRCGSVRRVMVIGSETLSRVSDPHDRDSLIYADGAGAVILEGRDTSEEIGVLSHAVRSDTLELSETLHMGRSYRDAAFLEALFIKMAGRKVYKYALNTVASSIKEALDGAGVDVRDVTKVFVHQANGKMDEAILAALYELYGVPSPPDGVMPMTISWLGNSSVATLPTLLDLVCKSQMPGHSIVAGDTIVFAAVGAGMHINAVVYRWA